MTDQKKDSEAKPATTNPNQSQEAQPQTGSGGLWIALIMVGVLALIIGVEMLRSKS